jgi:hypothetical protein
MTTLLYFVNLFLINGVNMTFAEVMAYYDYNMTRVAQALQISKQAVGKWKKKNQIPFDKQCQIQVITNGNLKADKENK